MNNTIKIVGKATHINIARNIGLHINFKGSNLNSFKFKMGTHVSHVQIQSLSPKHLHLKWFNLKSKVKYFKLNLIKSSKVKVLNVNMPRIK